MARFIERFWAEEDGNTTIDWMVLTAGLVLLGVAVMAAVATSSTALSANTSAIVSSVNTGI